MGSVQEKNNRKGSWGSSINLIHGRVLPEAKELERAVLGVMLMIPDTVETVASKIRAEVFYSENYRRIYAAILELYDAGTQLDLPVVIQRLKDKGELEMVGGAYQVTKLTNDAATTAALESYCLILHQKFIQRELIRISGEIYASSFDDSRDVFDMLDEAESAVMSIGNSIQSDSKHLSSVLVDTVKQIQYWRTLPSDVTGVRTGFPMLDRATRGWQPGDLIILAARPSVGKSALAMALARAAAAEKAVAFWSLEMSNIQLALRLLAAESGTVLHRLQTGRLDDNDMDMLHRDAVAKLAKIPIYMDDKPSLSMVQLRAKARRLKKKHDIGLIIIDYLQLMEGKGDTREQEVSSISRGLKKLAKELGIPIIALSQLSRGIESRQGQRREPQLSDLRESGAIEQDADVVLLLWGPDETDIDQDKDLLYRRYLKIAKARSGVLLRMDLDFRNEIQAFKEFRKLEIPEGPTSPGNWKSLGTQELF